jgi:hypothetical protein
MSLRSQALGPVLEETTRVARAAFPRGHLSMQRRDERGPIFTDTGFAPLFAVRGRPTGAPWRLALVTMRHYAEGLSDVRPPSGAWSPFSALPSAWKKLYGHDGAACIVRFARTQPQHLEGVHSPPWRRQPSV